MADLQAIAMELEKMECTVHHQHPEIEVTGEQLRIAACCDAFYEEVNTEMWNKIDEQMSRGLSGGVL